jgi:hypothetical protein
MGSFDLCRKVSVAARRHGTAVTARLLHLRDVPVAGQKISYAAEYRRSPCSASRARIRQRLSIQFAQLQNLIRLYDVLRAQLQRLLDFGPLIFTQDLRHFKSQNVGAYVNCSGAMLPGH